MAIDINSAFSAYNMALNRAKASISSGTIGELSPIKAIRPVGSGDTDEDPTSFSGILKNSARQVERQQRRAEDLTKLAIAGQADIIEVTMAVNDAETTLQSVIQIRDKVVAAYKEILAMPM